MPKPPRKLLNLATLPVPPGPEDLPGPGAPPDPAGREVQAGTAAQPVARFFGVPFLKGLAQEVTAIHLCPAKVHLASIRDRSALTVYNRQTLKPVDLGENACARRVAFRPRAAGEEAIEMAIVGPLDKPEIARLDLQGGRWLASLPMAGASALQYSGDGRFVAAGDARGEVRVWLLGAGGPAQVLETRFEAQVESLAFHPEHPTLYATLANGALVETALAPSAAAPVGAALRERAPGVRFHAVCAGPSGYCIYLAGRDDRVYIVDTATGEAGAFSPKVGPITSLQVLPASGHLCVLGPRSVYLLHPEGPDQRDHLALVCPFDEPIYAAWELDQGAVLVFHAAEGSLSA